MKSKKPIKKEVNFESKIMFMDYLTLLDISVGMYL
jgi:hypothetical protein